MGDAALVERHVLDSGYLLCLYILSIVQYIHAFDLSVLFRYPYERHMWVLYPAMQCYPIAMNAMLLNVVQRIQVDQLHFLTIRPRSSQHPFPCPLPDLSVPLLPDSYHQTPPLHH